MGRQCDTCIYGNKPELYKPCIVYKGVSCELYEPKGVDRDKIIEALFEYPVDIYEDENGEPYVKAAPYITLVNRLFDICEYGVSMSLTRREEIHDDGT